VHSRERQQGTAEDRYASVRFAGVAGEPRRGISASVVTRNVSPCAFSYRGMRTPSVPPAVRPLFLSRSSHATAAVALCLPLPPVHLLITGVPVVLGLSVFLSSSRERAFPHARDCVRACACVEAAAENSNAFQMLRALFSSAVSRDARGVSFSRALFHWLERGPKRACPAITCIIITRSLITEGLNATRV